MNSIQALKQESAKKLVLVRNWLFLLRLYVVVSLRQRTPFARLSDDSFVLECLRKELRRSNPFGGQTQ